MCGATLDESRVALFAKAAIVIRPRPEIVPLFGAICDTKAPGGMLHLQTPASEPPQGRSHSPSDVLMLAYAGHQLHDEREQMLIVR